MFSRFAAIARAARTAARPALVRDPAPGSAPNAGFAAMGAASAALLGLAGVAHADEAEHGLHSAAYPWPHEGMFDSYDHASIRRGHQVYQQVCAACHSLNLVAYRNLVGVCYTEDEVKAMAEEIEVSPRARTGPATRPPASTDVIATRSRESRATASAERARREPDRDEPFVFRSFLNPCFFPGLRPVDDAQRSKNISPRKT